jgi:D5 N terminal like
MKSPEELLDEAGVHELPPAEPTKGNGVAFDAVTAEPSATKRKKLNGDNGASAEPPSPALSDDGLALLFAQRRADDMRFVAERGKWLLWDGARWAYDDTLACFDAARAVCREKAAGCKGPKANVLASAKTVAAVERLAKSDRRIAARIDQWDGDNDAFNIEAGKETS